MHVALEEVYLYQGVNTKSCTFFIGLSLTGYVALRRGWEFHVPSISKEEIGWFAWKKQLWHGLINNTDLSRTGINWSISTI